MRVDQKELQRLLDAVRERVPGGFISKAAGSVANVARNVSNGSGSTVKLVGAWSSGIMV
jgi:hypothetical protein